MTARILAAGAPDAVEQAVAVLREGRVVGIPTETVYGLAVLPLDNPLTRLVAIKRRSADKGIALLIDSIEQVRSLVLVPPAAERLAARLWPGALTMVLPALPGVNLPEMLSGGRPTIALRLPDHAVPRHIARLVGPFAASSANISGEPDATTAEALLAVLGEEVDLVLDDGPVRGGVPSTVVAVTVGQAAPTILRLGALSREQILAAAG